MSRKSRTPYAILGALSHGPKSGYDISRLFDSQSLFFWSESYGQIYPTLKRLLEDEMVEMKSEARESGPERKIYSVTERGTEHLQLWLDDRALKSSVRDEFMLKLYFTPEADKTRTIERLESLQTQVEQHLETLDEECAGFEEDALHRDLALSWARHYHEARLAWSQKSIEALTGKKAEKKKKKKDKKKKKKKSRE
jgi:PadR family transcriptional regulator AphA